MTNLFKNVIKTLLFFDLIVIIDHYFIDFIHKSSDVMLFKNQLALALLVGAFTLFFYFIVDKKSVSIPIKKNPRLAASAGAIGGALLPVLCACCLAIFGTVEFKGFNSISVGYFFQYNLPSIILITIFTELMFRGYLFSLYKKHYGFWAATIISTGLWLAVNTQYFGGSKLLLINLILLNLLICCLYELTGSLLAVIVARIVYMVISSFALGSLSIEGIPVWIKAKGLEAFAIEGSFIFTVIALLLLYFFLYVKYDINKKAKSAAITIYKFFKNFDFNELITSLKFKFLKLKKKFFKK